MVEKIAVIGLGYVGLPVAVGMARAHGGVVGFDIDAGRIAALRQGDDATGEFRPEELAGLDLHYSDDAADLAGLHLSSSSPCRPRSTHDRQPDLTALRRACAAIGPALRPGGLVVFESTVYPGVTEEVCGPLLAAASGLRQGQDFQLGYSPERINPGDREHRLETITKVVAADRPGGAGARGGALRPGRRGRAASGALDQGRRGRQGDREHPARPQHRADERAGADLRPAGHPHPATCWRRRPPSGTSCPSRRGWSAATASASTPTTSPPRPRALGYHPEVILAGRRINDGMGGFVAQKLVKLLIAKRGAGAPGAGGRARPDLQGERARPAQQPRARHPASELASFGIAAMVHDPLADAGAARHEYGLELAPLGRCCASSTPWCWRCRTGPISSSARPGLAAMLGPRGILIDVRSALDPARLPAAITYWSL